MRLLELEANALLFTLFSETSDGMQHIRAFQWQSNYMWQCHGMLDYSQKPYYYMFCIQRWLTLVLELSTCFIAVALVSLALFFTNSTSETAIGLAMINLITFSQLLNDLIAAWVELEASLGAIARTRDFNRTTPQEKPVDRLPKAKLPDYWPTEGGIEFANVNARYRSVSCEDFTLFDRLSLSTDTALSQVHWREIATNIKRNQF
jgi:ABC-type bacteriocin/lantibiotic exporter with double-glycine peptidase domain